MMDYLQVWINGIQEKIFKVYIINGPFKMEKILHFEFSGPSLEIEVE